MYDAFSFTVLEVFFNFDASDTFLVVNYKHSHQRGINRLVVMCSGNTFVWIYYYF